MLSAPCFAESAGYIKVEEDTSVEGTDTRGVAGEASNLNASAEDENGPVIKIVIDNPTPVVKKGDEKRSEPASYKETFIEKFKIFIEGIKQFIKDLQIGEKIKSLIKPLVDDMDAMKGKFGSFYGGK